MSVTSSAKWWTSTLFHFGIILEVFRDTYLINVRKAWISRLKDLTYKESMDWKESPFTWYISLNDGNTSIVKLQSSFPEHARRECLGSIANFIINISSRFNKEIHDVTNAFCIPVPPFHIHKYHFLRRHAEVLSCVTLGAFLYSIKSICVPMDYSIYSIGGHMSWCT